MILNSFISHTPKKYNFGTAEIFLNTKIHSTTIILHKHNFDASPNSLQVYYDGKYDK